jgi:hypothetical protein
VAEKEASGDFDYLWEDTDASDGVDGHAREVDREREYSPHHDEPPPRDDEFDGFDPFDANTWAEILNPPPKPWYRSRQALGLLIASGAALSAIVVSVVLLVFRELPTGEDIGPAPTAPPTTTPVATATSDSRPPELPPPLPPPPPPSAVESAPVIIRPRIQPRLTKEPEIGVTRTPATRQPISVAPQPRRPR